MTTLPAIASLTDEELMALTGQGEAKKPTLPRLKINRDAEDEHGNATPIGTFQISQGEDHALFSKTAVLRPIINTYQYMLFDPNAKKTVNRSIQIKSWGEEAIDELGTLRCGKIPNKQAAQLNAREQERNKLVKCYRMVYGLVSLKGVDEKGEKGEVTNLPVKMKLSGSNFMPFGEALDLINGMKRPMFAFNTHLSLKREKNGATVYYVMAVEPDLKTILPLTDEIVDTWKVFQESINRETKYITDKHREAVQTRTTDTPPWEPSPVSDALSADFNDPIPDLGR